MTTGGRILVGRMRQIRESTMDLVDGQSHERLVSPPTDERLVVHSEACQDVLTYKRGLVGVEVSAAGSHAVGERPNILQAGSLHGEANPVAMEGGRSDQ